MHHFNNRVRRVELKPPLREVYVVRFLVMIVLEKLSHHKKIQRQHVFAMIAVVEIGITIFVPAPVYDCTLDRTH